MDPTAQAVIAATASFFFVTLIFAGIVLLCKTTRNSHTNRRRRRTPTRTNPTPDLSSIAITESASFDPSLDQISMPELITATKNFSTDGIIGDGSFGYVYKARLSNGVTVAVKKLSKDAFQGFREFQAEMETLGQNSIRHPNLVRILGYCVSDDDRVLIYEFIEKGSLDQWIYDTSTSLEEKMYRCGSGSGSGSKSISISMSSCGIRPPLKWETRVKIIKGVAKGLLFLHTLDTPIIHRDIKASNVLLDKEFEAHIADFGLARRVELWHSHVSTQVAGTMGYMPPEYKDGLTAATVKADVYSFGVLMIEVAAGRRPNWPIKTKMKVKDEDEVEKEIEKEVTLVEWAKYMAGQGRQIEMIDSNVTREGLREDEVGEYIRIACLCASESAKERPYMAEVVKLLNQLPL